MRRASFAGALTSLGLGAVLAFAVRVTWRDFDVRAAGVIVMLGALADLVIRILIADSPLLSPQSADIAAAVEPLGEPLLDARGNPLIVEIPAETSRSPLNTVTAGGIRGTARPSVSELSSPGARPADSVGPAREDAVLDRADRVTHARPLGIPESPVAVTTLAGHAVHSHGRKLSGRRIRP